jgi:hypothetical protein
MLVETELERAGLWDRRVDAEDSPDSDGSQGFQLTNVTLPQIAGLASTGMKQLQAHRPS